MASNRIPSDSTAASSGGGDRMDIDSHQASSRHTSITAPSIHEGPQTYTDRPQRIEHLQARLQNLHLEAQRQLNEQPKSTQLDLTTQTRAIFDSYGKHGSQALLSHSIKTFFNDDRNVDHLQIWSAADASERHAAAAQTMEQLRIVAAARAIKLAKHAGLQDPQVPSSNIPIPDSNPHDSPLDGRRTTINDEESTSLIREWPFFPADITIEMPAHLDLPPTLLPTVSRILDLYNAQANARLHHHTSKYITLHPTPDKTAHGYALLRLGVAERYSELVSNLFVTEQTISDGLALGLTQSQRAFLRDLYDRTGAAGPGRPAALTQREKALVAEMLRLEVADVEQWWEVQGAKLRGYKAMRVWMAARELELVRKAKMLDLY